MSELSLISGSINVPKNDSIDEEHFVNSQYSMRYAGYECAGLNVTKIVGSVTLSTHESYRSPAAFFAGGRGMLELPRVYSPTST